MPTEHFKPIFIETKSSLKDNKKPAANPIDAGNIRTMVARAQFDHKGLGIEMNGKRYLAVGPSKKRYLMIDGKVTTFADEPVILLDIYSKVGEALLLDPKSSLLNFVYEYILSKITPLAICSDPLEVLKIVNKKVAKLFGGEGTTELVNVASNICKDEKLHLDKIENIPVMNIEAFFFCGICRHRALVAAYVISRMIKDSVLPAGAAFFQQYNVPGGGGHAWVVYRYDMTNKLYIVDPMENATYEITDKMELGKDCKYGEEFGQRIKNGFYNKEVANYQGKGQANTNSILIFPEQPIPLKVAEMTVSNHSIFLPIKENDKPKTENLTISFSNFKTVLVK